MRKILIVLTFIVGAWVVSVASIAKASPLRRPNIIWNHQGKVTH